MWENCCIFRGPHKSRIGLTPYGIYRAKMNTDIQGQPKTEV